VRIIYWAILTISVVAFLISPQLAAADGGVFPPPDFYLTETDQKAVIVHENNLETIILSVNFKGNPKNFGWVIPVPAKPEVNKSQDELFTALANLTKLATETAPNFGTLGLGEKEAATKPQVEIIETKEIESYDISVVTSEDSNALAKWLSDNNYQVPDTASPILEDYIDNSWYFICIKINTAKLTTVGKEQLKTGHATPLKIQFESDDIIYPLKLSSIVAEYQKNSLSSNAGTSAETSKSQMAIMLYVLADGKKSVPGFDTKYANWLEKAEIEKLAYDSKGDSWYKTQSDKLFLTKLYRLMSPDEMTSDLILRPTANNNPVGVSVSNPIIDGLIAVVVFALIFIVIFLSPIGLAFLVLSLIQFYAKSKAGRIICWILQTLDLLLTILISLIAVLIVLRNMNQELFLSSVRQTLHFNWSNVAIIVAFSIFVIAEILVMIFQYRHQKQYQLGKDDNPAETADNMFEDSKSS